MIRKPAVSGKFYPSNVSSLLKSIEDSFLLGDGPGSIPELSRSKIKNHELKSIMVPHAGYMYSGSVASNAYYNLALDGFPETFIIIGPNHTGVGEAVSVFNDGGWISPLGHIEVDREFADTLIGNSEFLKSDYVAHLNEHSVEVQLPFLQYFSNDFRIVPIVMGIQDKDIACDIVDSVVKSEKELGRDVCIVASSDLSHFNDESVANIQDRLVLDDIVAMDEDKLLRDIRREDITMCGYGPVMVSMLYSKITGQGICELLKYSTSAKVTGDSRSVVGYASAFFI